MKRSLITSACVLAVINPVSATTLLVATGSRITSSSPETATAQSSQDSTWRRLQAAGVDALQQGKYDAAEREFLMALEAARAARAPGTVIAGLENSLGLTYRSMKRFAEAEQRYRRALATVEQASGATYADVSSILTNLATLLMAQARYKDAEPVLRQSVMAAELALPDGDYKLALPLYQLGDVCLRLQKYSDADRFLSRALQIRERHRGAQHLEVAVTLHRIAALRVAQGRPAESLPLFERAISVYETTRGRSHAETIAVLKEYAAALQQSGRGNDADRVAADVKSRTTR
jgi:tetratricopeptide (TPR) repeat protein